MDIISSASAVVGLVFNFATVAKTCKAVHGRYKDAGITIDSIREESETLQAALQQLANLMMHDASALTSQWDTDRSLSGTFERVVKGFERTIKGLQAELNRLKFEKETPGRLEKAKVVWNEDGMREHLGRLRSQAGALQLLLQVLQVGAVSEVKHHVKNLEAALIQASVSSTGNESGQSEEFSQLNPLFVEHQGDLLDLEWSEKIAEDVPSRPEYQSAHLKLLQKAFVTDGEVSSPNGSMTSATVPTASHETKPRNFKDPFRDVEFSPDPQQPHENENVEDKIDSPSPKDTPKWSPNLNSIQDQSLNPGELVPELISAVIRGDVEKTTELLDSGHDIESRHPENKRTAAMFATLLNHSEILELLLERGASVTAEDRHRRTALHFAASEGNCLCTAILLSRKAPVEVRDAFREMPLHRASRYGKSNIVKLLLPYYNDPLNHGARAGWNSLHLVALYGYDSVVELLCRHIKRIEHLEDCRLKSEGASTAPRGCSCPAIFPHLEDVDFLGNTPLHLGVVSHLLRAVSSLLQFSKSAADTPLRETNIITEALLASTPITWCRPLHNALDDPEMLKVLLDGGADMNLADCEGFTPLMEAIHTKNEGATKVLLAHGADFTTSCPTHNSTTSLDEAVLSFTHAILDQLDIGDPRNDMSTDRGRAILREAQKNRKWDIVQSLIKHCPQKDCIGKILDDEETLLYAIKRATESVVDFLLANGANPNHQLHLEHDDHWALPISVTAKRNSIRKAKSLLKHGARLLLENSHGMLPVEHAIFYGERKTVSWFLEETITAIKKETRTTQIASTMTRILVKCASDTCHMGSLETLQLVLTLAKQEVDNIFQQGPFLHLAVHYGRIEITKYLLASGFNVHQLSPEGCSALDMAFSPLDAEANRLGNKREDYEECIKLVQKAVGRGSPSTSRSSKSSTQKRR